MQPKREVVPNQPEPDGEAINGADQSAEREVSRPWKAPAPAEGESGEDGKGESRMWLNLMQTGRQNPDHDRAGQRDDPATQEQREPDHVQREVDGPRVVRYREGEKLG